MTESLLRLDAIARSFRQTQHASLSSFRALHAAVRDIANRSSKIKEATRAHRRALDNVAKTELELATAVQSYTIPEWLTRVGESCCKHSKGDVNCTTIELCRAMQKLVFSLAYISCKPFNTVGEALEDRVKRYVKSIVAAAEDRVLLRFMQAQASATSGAAAASSSSHRAVAGSAAAAAASSSSASNDADAAIIFGPPGAAPVEMAEVTDLLRALFRNYNRTRAVLEVKAYVLEEIHRAIETKRSEFRRLRNESGDPDEAATTSSAAASSSSFSFFGSSQLMGSAPERLGTALRELIGSCHTSRGGAASGGGDSNAAPASTFFGSRDDAACVLGVSRAARSLCLDVSEFLDRYVLAAVPPPPKRRTATQALLESRLMHADDGEGDDASDKKQQKEKGIFDDEKEDDPHGGAGENEEEEDDGRPPLDPAAADEIDELRAAVLIVPAEVAEMVANYALDMLAKLVTDIAVKQPYCMHTVPITMLETVQEAWHWRHTSRRVAGDTSALRDAVDSKVDVVLGLVYDNLCNLRDEPGNLSAQNFLDLALGDEGMTFSFLPPELSFVVGIRAYADKNPKVLDERVSQKFRRAVWHPERDGSFGMAPPLIDALRRMISAHEATLHVVFATSVARVDTLISKADAAIEAQKARLVREARKQQARTSAKNREQQQQQQQQQHGSSGRPHASSSGTDKERAARDFSALTARAAIDAESAARGVFEYVRNDIEDFFLRSIRNLIVWATAVSTAAFLLHHAAFQEDADGDPTSACLDTEDDLFWQKIKPGKLRFHPSLFRANTIQKIMNRLSSTGVFDVDPSQQLVWHQRSGAAGQQAAPSPLRINNPFVSNSSASPFKVSAITAAPSASAATADPFSAAPISGGGGGGGGHSIFSPQNDAPARNPVDAMFEFSPAAGSSTAQSAPDRHAFSPSAAAAGFDSPAAHDDDGADGNTKRNDDDDDDAGDAGAMFARVAAAESRRRSSTASAAPADAFGGGGGGGTNADAVPWRQKLLDTLLAECRESLAQEIEMVASRWATILPPAAGEHWDAMAASPSADPLTHDQRAAAKTWYWDATCAIHAELQLWESGVLAVEDAGLKAALGEASVKALEEVLDDVEGQKLKGREWSTRSARWFKIPRAALLQAVRQLQLPESKEDKEDK